jgi:hypothetical protein
MGHNTTRDASLEERRDSPRYNIKLFAQRRWDGPLVERRGNIGIGGFCYEEDRDLATGSRIDVFFRLPGTTRWIHAVGEVLGRSQGIDFMGVRGRFTAIDFEDERVLARWLDDMTLELARRAA